MRSSDISELHCSSNLMFLFVSRNIEKDPVCKKCSHNLKTYGQVIKRSEFKNTVEFSEIVSYKSKKLGSSIYISII